ncbi:MAG: hypothetical protein KF726_21325 [Anaerolineae bacterium]|nr:hypothetical protein [Anaerolineae bacterium]
MIWLIIGFITYIGTAALGTSAQLGLVNTRPFRWLHHALFGGVWLTLILIVLLAWGNAWLVALIPVAAAMAILPRFRAGTRAHCTCALVGLGGYGAALVWALIG